MCFHRQSSRDPLSHIRGHGSGEDCDGPALVSLVNPEGKPLRRSCAICGASTATFCAGCKRHLCADKGHREKLRDGKFGGPEGRCRMMQHEQGDESWDKSHLFAVRSCYHIGHEDCMGWMWDLSNSRRNRAFWYVFYALTKLFMLVVFRHVYNINPFFQKLPPWRSATLLYDFEQEIEALLVLIFNENMLWILSSWDEVEVCFWVFSRRIVSADVKHSE